jgi:hypothetical protein
MYRVVDAVVICDWLLNGKLLLCVSCECFWGCVVCSLGCLELISGPGYNTEKAAGPLIQSIRANTCTPRWRSTCWRRWRLRTWAAARADTGPQTTGREHGARATPGGGGFSGPAINRGGNNSSGIMSSGGWQTAKSQQWKEVSICQIISSY